MTSVYASMYDALKSHKSIVLDERYAIWVDATHKRPAYRVAELLSNGRTQIVSNETEFLGLVTFLQGLQEAGELPRKLTCTVY